MVIGIRYNRSCFRLLFLLVFLFSSQIVCADLVECLILEDCDVTPEKPKPIQEGVRNFNPDHATKVEALNEVAKWDWGCPIDERKFDSWLKDGRVITDETGFHLRANPLVNILASNGILCSATPIQGLSTVASQKIPVLLLKAEHDSCLSEKGLEEMLRIYPEIKVANIKGSAHSIHKTTTDAFVAVMKDFLQEYIKEK